MFQRIVYHRSMDAINSYTDALLYEKEALIVPLDYLARQLPDHVQANILDSGPAVGFYSGDAVRPQYVIGSRDSFYLRDPASKQLVPVGLVPNLPVHQLFIKSPLLQSHIPNPNPIRIYDLCGQAARLGPSEWAKMKMISFHAFALLLNMVPLFSLKVATRFASLERLYALANQEGWFRHESYRLQTFANNNSMDGRLFQPCEEDFKAALVNHLTGNLGILVRQAEEFFGPDLDCCYTLDVHSENLILIKGIDHKYLPYYANKYGSPIKGI